MNITNTQWFAEKQRVGMLAFIWVGFWASIIQLVLLPYIFPSWHAGDGLLVGGDWNGFHRAALELADDIRLLGWSEWQLRPNGWAPSGIAAFFYVITSINKPWVLIPFNATLHAIAAMVLFDIISRFVVHKKAAFIGVLPFIVFPSAMTWCAMLHKDSLFIAGCLLFFWGWLECLNQQHLRHNKLIHSVVVLAAIWCGMFFVWIVRDYFLDVLQLSSILCFCLVICNILYKSTSAGISKTVQSSMLPVMVLLLSLTAFQSASGWQVGIPTVETSVVEIPVIETPTVETPSVETPSVETPTDKFRWQRTKWIPHTIDMKIRKLAKSRDGFIHGYPHAMSNIDVDVPFRSAGDVIKYIPRALQIVFLYPSPVQIFADGRLKQTTIMRRAAGFEMIVVYVGLVGLAIAFFKWWRHVSFYILTVSCVASMLSYALVVTNVGTLYRMRYGFLLTLVALGLAALFEVLCGRHD